MPLKAAILNIKRIPCDSDFPPFITASLKQLLSSQTGSSPRAAAWTRDERHPARRGKPQACSPSTGRSRASDAIRLKHYSYHTEQAYVHWIKRYILFHDVRHPTETGAAEVEAFLAHLAVKDNVAATLPPEVVKAARERGRTRDLEATVKELLAELERAKS